MANRNKEKGSRLEMAVVKKAQSYGMTANRIPYSGALANWKGDVEIYHQRVGKLVGECKVKKSGFKFLYDSLGPHDVLIVHEVNPENGKCNLPHIKSTAKPMLAVLTLDRFLELLVKEQS